MQSNAEELTARESVEEDGYIRRFFCGFFLGVIAASCAGLIMLLPSERTQRIPNAFNRLRDIVRNVPAGFKLITTDPRVAKQWTVSGDSKTAFDFSGTMRTK